MQLDARPTAASARLSILVPVYRSEATIGDLVDTVVEVMGPQANLWEIILVNDGSPDNSHAVILQAMERHPGLIRYGPDPLCAAVSQLRRAQCGDVRA
jgi:glycosyltransferase involved in cell wall biosynthesis